MRKHRSNFVILLLNQLYVLTVKKKNNFSHENNTNNTAQTAMPVFWAVTPCGLVDRYQRLRGTYCLHLQGFRSEETLVFSF
jgi:hypothetical protein